MQAAAEPEHPHHSRVQRQTAGLFVAEDRGAHELKGVSEPVTLYRIVRASGGGRRSGARALTSFVGREEELGRCSVAGTASAAAMASLSRSSASRG